MKRVFLFLMLFGTVSFVFGTDTGLLMFPYSSSRMAAGNSFGNDSGDLTDPGFLYAAGESGRISAFTGLISGGINVYYFAFSGRSIIADIMFYDWGEIEGRDEFGHLTGYMRPYDLSLMAGYVKRMSFFSLAFTLRLLKRDYEYSDSVTLIPDIMVAWEQNRLRAGGALWLYEGANYVINAGLAVGKAEIRAAARKHSTDDAMTVHLGGAYRLSKSYEISAGLDNGRLTAGFSASADKYSFAYSVFYDDKGYHVNGIQLGISI